MKLIACIKKEIKLICGNGWKGIFLLLFPILLLFLIIFFMRGMANENTYLKPFSIAVRLGDNSEGSNLLITQLRNVSLFDRVVTGDSINEDELFEEDCAAVLDVPENFFYDLYDMQDTDVKLILNPDMPREAYTVRSTIGSLMGILEKNQRVYYADAKIRYGEIDGETQAEIFENYSNASVREALQRLEYFDMDALYEDEKTSQTAFFCIGVISMLLMFIPLCIVRNLHEEKELGIIERLEASNSGSFHMLLSKVIASAILTALPVAAVLLITGLPNAVRLIPSLLVLFLASFSFFLLLSLICKSSERTQLVGNTILLLMLVLGGAFFPYRLIPSPVRYASYATLPYYVSRAVYAVSFGRGVADSMRAIIPVLISVPVFLGLAYVIYKKPFSAKRRRV